MSAEFDPKLAELIQRGQSAALIMNATALLCSECIEMVLRQVEQTVNHGNLTAERALGFCHEIAAFRRIVSRQRAHIDQGRAAAARLETS